MSKVRNGVKEVARTVLPMSVRKPLAVWLSRKGQGWRSVELLADWARRDPNAYHRFMWKNHLGYAESYEVPQRFGDDRIHPSRLMLFDDLLRFMNQRGMDPAKVESIFEVGCSMGYLLRHLETRTFQSATRLEGIDIDEYAIEAGKKHLQSQDSRVRVGVGDMRDLEPILGESEFDLIICAGVLMYLRQENALEVVKTMLRHTKGLLVMAGLAHPEVDNRQLAESAVRESDGSFIHNLDAIAEAAGGEILYRRWEGPLDIQGNTICFVFCARNRGSSESAP
jgi:SAM-dependent methyltransferase